MVGEDLNLQDSDTGSTSTVISAVVSSLMVLILLILAATFIGGKINFTNFFGKYVTYFFLSVIYGKRNPGGIMEKIAARLETPYKRFGILDEENNDQVEMGRKQEQNNNNNNNNEDINTTVAF